MRYLTYSVATVILLAVGFGAGYWFRDAHSPSRAEMEDYALANILENVGYAAFIAKGDIPQLREIIDINLNGDLARVIRYQGSPLSEEVAASKIRTLNAAARLWDGQPPFSPQTKWLADSSVTDAQEWKEMTAQNMKLLEWAKSQCASTPSLKCATGPIGR